MIVQKKIVQIAESFVGQEEIRGNLGFIDDQFQTHLENVGWHSKQAWCAYFAELVWKLAYANFNSTYIEVLDKLFSSGAVSTYNNFSCSDEFDVSMTPEVGDIVIWQNHNNGKPHWSGHAGIVTSVNGDTFYTIEGNTNDDYGREGYVVARKRCTKADRGNMKVKGFIKPVKVW